MNKQIPPECPACFHPAHVGRCGIVDVLEGAISEMHTSPCQCPGPSDSAKRLASRPYTVGLDERLRDRDYACAYLKECAEDPDETCFLVALFDIVRAHEVKPDEPPCPVSAQRVRDCADRIGFLAQLSYTQDFSQTLMEMREDLLKLGEHMERKGA